MEQQCPLCKTGINEGARVCTGCGAMKQRFMPPIERFIFTALLLGSLFIAGSSSSAGLLIIPAAVVGAWVYRYATSAYWVKN